MYYLPFLLFENTKSSLSSLLLLHPKDSLVSRLSTGGFPSTERKDGVEVDYRMELIRLVATPEPPSRNGALPCSVAASCAILNIKVAPLARRSAIIVARLQVNVLRASTTSAILRLTPTSRRLATCTTAIAPRPCHHASPGTFPRPLAAARIISPPLSQCSSSRGHCSKRQGRWNVFKRRH